MDNIQNKIQSIAGELDTINTNIRRINTTSRSNIRSIENIRGKITNLLQRIRNVKSNIERNKNSPFLSTDNPRDLQEFIISFLGGLEIELADILQEM